MQTTTSKLDDRLKEVIIQIWYETSRYGQTKDIIQLDDEAIPQIKQVFAYNGWIEEQLNNQPRHTVRTMTGQEWFQKFRDELSATKDSDNTSIEDRKLLAAARNISFKAARRVASIE